MKGIKFKKLLVILLVLVLASSGIFAATSVTLRLKGTIAPVTSLAISTSIADFGIFTEDAVVDLLVATVFETSNSASGYTVTLSTNNGSSSGLLSEVGGDTIPYSVKYNNAVVPFEAGTFVVTNSAFISSDSTSKSVTISYDITDITALNFGTYTDTLTFVIASS